MIDVDGMISCKDKRSVESLVVYRKTKLVKMIE